MLKRRVTPAKRASKRSRNAPRFRLSKAMRPSTAHRVIQGAAGNISINSTNGFTIGASSSLALSFAFCQGRVFYQLGTGGLIQLGNAFSNSTNLAGIFDQWRLRKVDVEIFLSRNSQAASNQNSLPVVYAVKDFDDAIPLGSANIALGYADCKTIPLGQADQKGAIHRMSIWNPCAIGTAQAGAGGTVAAFPVSNKWIDSLTPDTPHYGLKLFMDQFDPTNTIVGFMVITFRCLFEYKITK